MDFLTKLLTSSLFKAIIVFVVFFAAAKLLYYFIAHIAIKWAKKTRTELDDIILSKIKIPLFYLIILAGVTTAINILPFLGYYKPLLSKIIASIILAISCYLAALFLNLLIKAWLSRAREVVGKTRQMDLVAVSRKMLNLVVFILLIIFILNLWGVKVTALVASLGIAGLVIGLALQTTLSNMFGGITLIADKSFKIGDFIQLETGEAGEIIDVGLRSTRIKSFDEGNEIIIPNNLLMSSKIINYGRPQVNLKRRIKIGVAYGSDIEKVKRILLECASKIDKILKNPPPEVYFMEMADFSLNFLVVFWISNYKYRFIVQDNFMSLAYRELQNKGIEIPFPTRTIYIEKK